MNTHTTTKTTAAKTLKTWKVTLSSHGQTQNFDVAASSKSGVMGFMSRNGITGQVLSIS